MKPSEQPSETLSGEEQGLPDLRVFKYIDDKGIPHVQSVWIPDKTELAMINAGYGIYVDIYGKTHAPISVGVHPEITS